MPGGIDEDALQRAEARKRARMNDDGATGTPQQIATTTIGQQPANDGAQSASAPASAAAPAAAQSNATAQNNASANVPCPEPEYLIDLDKFKDVMIMNVPSLTESSERCIGHRHRREDRACRSSTFLEWSRSWTIAWPLRRALTWTRPCVGGRSFRLMGRELRK